MKEACAAEQLLKDLIRSLILIFQYDLSAAQFSPDGRVFQIEYATKAVENSGYVYHITSMSVCVCVCVCVCYGRSAEVIRPPGKCYFFLWEMATVGQREGTQ